jgi:hypothetical protein
MMIKIKRILQSLNELRHVHLGIVSYVNYTVVLPLIKRYLP